MQKSIIDRYNHPYVIEIQDDSEEAFYLKVKDGETYVGQMLCSFWPDNVMVLEDLFIRNDVDAPGFCGPGRKIGAISAECQSDPMSRSQAQTRWKSGNLTLNYRNRGLGSALLILLRELATKRRIKTIFGSLISNDILHNPHLLQWYVHRGFTVTGRFPGCIDDAETYIRLEVPDKSEPD
jgi:hypothetical protein